jgi:cell division protease FtsH
MNGKQFRLGGKGGGKAGRNRFKNVGFAALVILFGLLAYSAVSHPTQLKTVPFSQVVNDANNGKISQIVVNGDSLQVTPVGQTKATEQSYKEAGSSIYEQGLKQGRTQLENKPDSSSNSIWVGVLTGVLPVVIIAGLLIFMFRSAQGQGNQALSFGKSRARLYGNEKDRITFKDVAGNDETKQDLEEVVEFLKFPRKFEGVGAKIPKGVLLVKPCLPARSPARPMRHSLVSAVRNS